MGLGWDGDAGRRCDGTVREGRGRGVELLTASGCDWGGLGRTERR